MELSGINLTAVFSGELLPQKHTLARGDILKAQVLSINGDRLLLEMLGQRLQVESSVKLNPGQDIFLEVDQFSKDGKIFMHQVKAKEAENFQKLQLQMQELEIPQNKRNFSILRELLNQDISPSKNMVKSLVQFAQKFQITDAKIPSLVWLWQQNLPITPKSIEFVNNSHNLRTSSLGELEMFLQSKNEFDQSLLVKLEQSLAAIKLESKQNTQEIAHKLIELPETLGMEFERAILNDNSTSKTLKLIMSRLKNNELLPSDQKQMLENISGRITHLQLLSQAKDAPPNLPMEGYINWGEEQQPFYLKFKHESPKEEQNESKGKNYSVYLFLKTPKLGQIAAKLRLLEGELAVHLEVEKISVLRLVQQKYHELGKKLEKLPLNLRNLTASVKDPVDLRKEWHKEFAIPLPGNLDVHV